MDVKQWAQKLPELVKKYRYAILVLAIGLLLLALPGKTASEEKPVTETVVSSETVDMAKELQSILSKIQGVGNVEVLLTVKAGETTLYQSDEDVSTSEDSSTIRRETVIITGSDRQQQALVTQILPPEYQGAVIVCQGADDVSVCLAVVEAVSKATGLGTDKITVLKMK